MCLLKQNVQIEVLNKLYDNIHENIYVKWTNQATARDHIKYLENDRTYMKNILFNKNQKGKNVR